MLGPHPRRDPPERKGRDANSGIDYRPRFDSYLPETMILRATYSPDDNKLRLYTTARLADELYQRIGAAGFKYAPKQELFYAPTWSPRGEDLLLELCGDIEDEDTTLVERAEERAERFGDYSERRAGEAESARTAVAAIAEHIPFGQPILVGHHSEGRARRDAERIGNGMSRAVRLWDQSAYWEDRARGALQHARYKARPDVRARRIRGLESERRGHVSHRERAEHFLGQWSEEGITLERAKGIANFDNRTSYRFPLDRYPRQAPASQYEGAMGLWSALEDGVITAEQARDLAVGTCRGAIAWCDRWIKHLDNRLTYERAMLEAQGGIATDQTKPEKGGACQCWASPGGRGSSGWSFIVKVNRVSVTIYDNWGRGGKNFTRTIEFDKLGAVMSKADVDAARANGRLVETPDGVGFYLGAPQAQTPEVPQTPEATAAAAPAADQPSATAEIDTARAGPEVAAAEPRLPRAAAGGAVLATATAADGPQLMLLS